MPEPQNARRFVPSSSTTASALAGAVTGIAIWLLHDFAHVDMPAEAASGLTTIIAIAAGYFLPGGRSQDVA